MEIIIQPTPEAATAIAARLIARLLKEKPDAVLGLATGATMEPVYAELVRRFRKGDVSFARVTTFNLDEYVGLSGQDPRSYRGTMDSQLFDLVDIDKARTFVPDGLAADTAAFASRYEAMIREAGGIDLQLLGIGRNGHIGFNEPGTSFASRTRVKTLTEATRRDNARFFASVDEVPRHCLTQGLGTIRDARALVLLAFGEAKADAVAGAVEGPVSASLPGSAIQLHPEVTVLVDEAAAAHLRFADYYRYAWDNRPDWAR